MSFAIQCITQRVVIAENAADPGFFIFGFHGKSLLQNVSRRHALNYEPSSNDHHISYNRLFINLRLK